MRPGTYNLRYSALENEPITLRLKAAGVSAISAGDDVELAIVTPTGGIVLTVVGGELTADFTTGQVTWSPTYDQLAALPKDDGLPYRLRVLFAGGQIQFWLKGYLTVEDR